MIASALKATLKDHGITDINNIEQWQEHIMEMDFNNGGVVRFYPNTETLQLIKVDWENELFVLRCLLQGHATEMVTDFESLQIIYFKSNHKFEGITYQHKYKLHDMVTGKETGVDPKFDFSGPEY